MNTTRRTFLQTAGAAGALGTLGLAGCAAPGAGPGGAGAGTGAAGKRAIVVGGGFGGATAAKYLKWFDPSIDVTLIEPQTAFTTCPFSNLYLGGIRDFASITHNYSALSGRHGVNVLHDKVVGVDPVKRTVATAGGRALGYDRLIVSPGIDFRFEEVPGYDASAATMVPHAWKAGPQTRLLRAQLESMDDGGLVIIAPPGNPFRCPPGPYERASMIAHYIKTKKPKSKLLILDAKDKFSKQGLFMEGWAKHYADIIEWVPAAKDGKVVEIDAANKVAITEFERHKASVLNFIPPQKAGEIAFAAGLTDQTGWCPVNFQTFESTLQPNIHVIGDAAITTKMPKSGNAANTQAKVCASAVAKLLDGEEPGVPTTTNTCYSLITPSYGISVTAVYRQTADGYIPVAGAGGVSPTGEGPKFRELEAKFARGWYANISEDIWG